MMDQTNLNTKQSDMNGFTPDTIIIDEASLITPEVEKVIANFTNEQLMKALYWTWDVFDRATMPYFVVGKTAEDIMANKLLEGDSIHIGVRLNDWASGAKRIVDAFAGEPEKKEDNLLTYNHEGVPVYLHIYPDDDCTRSLNQVMYEREYFCLPNPYSEFKKKYE